MPDPARPEPPEDIEDRDPGLARERTDLAWTRTAISFLALGAAMLRTNPPAGAVMLAAGAVVWGLGQLSAKAVAPTVRRPRLGPRRSAQIITVATALMSVFALILALLAPEHKLR